MLGQIIGSSVLTWIPLCIFVQRQGILATGWVNGGTWAVSWLTSSMLFHACPQRLLTPWPWVFWEPLSAKSWVSLAGMRRRGGKRERGWGRKGCKNPKMERVGIGTMWWFAAPSYTLFELPSSLGERYHCPQLLDEETAIQNASAALTRSYN